ncbi:exostosin family protein, partial [Ostertagia ostertagi]
MKTLARYALLGIGILLYGWLFHSDFSEKDLEEEDAPLSLQGSLEFEDEPIIEEGPAECSMHSCFDYTKCTSKLKVYVYPDVDELPPSEVYRKILTAVRESQYFVSDPKDACLFIVSVDTIDRDKISENYVRDVDRYISNLPNEVWNDGVNHIIFNLYHGTFPDYSDHNLGFATKKAMIARASPSLQNYRFDFDVSFPLFHKEHPLRSAFEQDVSFKTRDQYIVSFKGKRYVYGIGSETRDSLHHLHNGETVAMVTTCRHNNDWKAHQDARCESDNEAYDKWDYEMMMANSTFCLTPRGRRLGSFRFLEALRLGCIPVVLSDDWVLPFDEIIDWSAAAVIVPEDNVLLVPDILHTYTPERIFQMKQRGFFIYYRYFSSVEKIAITALEIVWERIRLSEGLDHRNWNHFHLHTPSALREVTLVIKAAEKPSSRLQKTVSTVAALDGLAKVVVLWPRKRGVPPIGADFGVKTALVFIEVFDPWQKGQITVGRVYMCIFHLWYLAVFGSEYLSEDISPIPSVLWSDCLPAVLNVVITERSMLPPIVIGERGSESWMRSLKLVSRWPVK